MTGLVREAYPVKSWFRSLSVETGASAKKQFMVTNDNLNWYAAYTRVNQELIIKKKLEELSQDE